MTVYRVSAENRERLGNAAIRSIQVEAPTRKHGHGYPEPAPKLPEWGSAVIAMVGDDFETGVELTDPAQIEALEAWLTEYAPGAVTRL
jgi:hypothetical protein